MSKTARGLGITFVSFLLAASAAAQSSDLFVTKTGPASSTVGSNVTFTVAIGNGGPDDAANTTLVDTLPAGSTFVSETQTSGPLFACTTPAFGAFGGTVNCTIATFVAGDGATFDIVVHVPAGAAGTTLINSAAISDNPDTDPNTENNTSAAGTDIPGGNLADVEVTKTGPLFAAPGASVTFTIAVSDLGPNDAQTVTLNDVLGAGLTFVSLTQTSGPTFTCPGSTTPCTIATLPNGTTATFNLVATVSSTPGTYNNSASVTSANDPTPENDAAVASVTVASADVGISKSAPVTAQAGLTFSYGITLTNSGPDPANDASFSDTLPAGITYVLIAQNTGPSANCANTFTFVTCDVPLLLNGQSASFTLTVQASSSIPNGTIVTNTAVASSSSNDTNPNNNSSSASTTITAQADMAISKTALATVIAGNNISYLITVANGGASDAANVSWTDVLPAGTSFVSEMQVAGPAFTCTTGATVSCNIATFAQGAVANFQLVAKVSPSTPSGTTISNTATVASTTTDLAPGNNSSTATTTVSTNADVSIIKSGPATVIAGNNISYTLTVSNAGPSDATTVSWTDTLPAGTTFVSEMQNSGPAFTCTTGATVSCNIATLISGASATFTLVVQTAASTPSGTTTSNTATVTSTTPDSTPGNNSSTATTTVSTSADVSITKSGPPTVIAGNNISYTITVSNAGPSDAANVSWTDTLPAGTSFVSELQNTGPAFTCTTGATVNCSIATLAAGASATFTLTANVSPSTVSMSNTATVASTTPDSTPANNSSTAITTVSASADLSITKSGSATVIAGNNISYSVTVSNAGPSNAANVTWTDVLPAGTSFVSENQGSGPTFTCTTGATVSCSIATLVPGASATFTLAAQSAASTPNGTIISNTATVAATTTDSTPGNNSATAATTVSTSADVSITKSAAATVTAGNTISYTITVTNAGPSDAASVNWTDTLPAGTTFVSELQNTGPAFTCTTGATVSCSIATLIPTASATFTLVATVSPSTPTGSTISNTATVASTTTDSTPGNNSSTASTTVSTSADVSITKSATAAVAAGNNISYTITVANAGPSDATSVTWTDVLPAGTTFVSEVQNTGPAFTCTTGATVSCSIATLISGGSASFTLVVQTDVATPAGATISNTATVTSTTTDPTAGNNSATASTTISGGTVDLSITKSPSAPPYLTGQPVTYTITVNNAGPAPAAAVTVTDTIPAGTGFVSATPSQGSCSGTTTVTCALGTIASGGSATISLVLTLPAAAGPLSNTATVSSANPDSNPANNSSTATITVISIAAIPTLSPLLLMLLAAILALTAAMRMRG